VEVLANRNERSSSFPLCQADSRGIGMVRLLNPVEQSRPIGLGLVKANRVRSQHKTNADMSEGRRDSKCCLLRSDPFHK
jgi:hypothetical protein